MRIAQVAPLAEAVPPKYYGGTEKVVSWLTEELVKQGHNVTLFASGDSKTSAKLVPVVEQGLRLAGVRDFTASTLAMVDQVCRREAEFDIIHFHVDLIQFPFVQKLFHKCVTTLHGRLDLPDYHPIYEAFSAMPLVSVSDHQRLPMPPRLNWISTIHHGLPPKLCPFKRNGGNYLAFLGRIAPEKRPDRAIEIARKSQTPLKIAAKVDPVDQDYFNQAIKPLLSDPLVEFIGEIDDRAKGQLLGNSLALLFPIDWPEPFGLVMIEAMSAGTPVIAWREGSVPEVVDDGITGVVVDTVSSAVQAVKQIRSLKRSVIRKRFEDRFAVTKMAANYVAAYEDILGIASATDARTVPEPMSTNRSNKSRKAFNASTEFDQAHK